MRSRLLAASAALLLLPACQSSEPSSKTSPSASSSSRPNAASTSAAPQRSARAVFAEAVRRLERDGRGTYAYRVMSDGVAVLDSRGSFDLGAKADHVTARLLDPTTLATGMWEDLRVGTDHYLKSDWFPDGVDKCYVKVSDSALGLADLDLAGFHLDPLQVLAAVRVTGYDRSSDDFVDGRLPLAQLADLVAINNLYARKHLMDKGVAVPIQVVITDGRLERWEITADDLEVAAASALSRGERKDLVLGDVTYVFIDGDAPEITVPPAREVTTDVDRPCAAGGTAA